MQSGRGIAVEARRPGATLLLALGAVLLLDQLTKVAVRSRMRPAESIPVIEDVFHITYVRNTGAAFGLMPGQQTLFIVTTVLVLTGIALYWWRARPTSLLLSLALGILAGGAIGNVIDRTVAGRVTDFFDFGAFPVFNVADIGIVGGAAGLFLWALFAPVDDRRPSAALDGPPGDAGQAASDAPEDPLGGLPGDSPEDSTREGA